MQLFPQFSVSPTFNHPHSLWPFMLRSDHLSIHTTPMPVIETKFRIIRVAGRWSQFRMWRAQNSGRFSALLDAMRLSWESGRFLRRRGIRPFFVVVVFFLRCSAQCCLSFRIGRFFFFVCLFFVFFFVVVVFFALTAMWLEILAISLCCSAQCGFRSNLPILCVARWLEILANSLCCSAQCGLRFRASKKSAFATPFPPPSAAALVKLHANAVVLFKIITLKCRGQKCLAIPKP